MMSLFPFHSVCDSCPLLLLGNIMGGTSTSTHTGAYTGHTVYTGMLIILAPGTGIYTSHNIFAGMLMILAPITWVAQFPAELALH